MTYKYLNCWTITREVYYKSELYYKEFCLANFIFDAQMRIKAAKYTIMNNKLFFFLSFLGAFPLFAASVSFIYGPEMLLFCSFLFFS